MIEELRRIGGAFLPIHHEEDIDLLIRAQHFGMATRLLDWTTNPLVAVWFACRDEDSSKSGYVYFYTPKPADLASAEKIGDPFSIKRTFVYRPRMNNARIIAQAGCFTLHPYSTKAAHFVAFDKNKTINPEIERLEIIGKNKKDFLDNLDQLGINYMSLFPDLEGTCRHLNWKYDI